MRRPKHTEPKPATETPGFRPGIRVVEFKGATRLHTHRDGDALASSFVEGAIVRVIPRADTDRAAVEEFLRGMGAAHVWFAPRAAEQAVVPARDRAAARPADVRPARPVVMELVDKAATRDRDRLRATVDRLLAEEGL